MSKEKSFEENKSEVVKDLTFKLKQLEFFSDYNLNDFTILNAHKTVCIQIGKIEKCKSPVIMKIFTFKANRAYKAGMRRYNN